MFKATHIITKAETHFFEVGCPVKLLREDDYSEGTGVFENEDELVQYVPMGEVEEIK